MAGRDDEDEGDLKEPAPHLRGSAGDDVDPSGTKAKAKARIDDPDQAKADPGKIEVDGEMVEVIADLDTQARGDDDEPKKAKKGDEDEEDGETESRSKKRRRDRKLGKERDREELRLALERIGGLEKTIAKLAEGQRATEEQSEATLLANTKAALNTVLNQRAQALADGDGPRANELDEAAYRLRRQRDDLEASTERRERGGDKGGGERDGGGNGGAQPGSQWSEGEIRTVQRFIDRNIPWFDRNGGDRDSRIALDISREMTAEKWRPLDDDWDEELLERLQEALPHRFEDDQDSGNGRQPKRKSPPVGGRGREGGSGGGGNGKSQFRLTPAHKQALADSGHEPGTPEYNSIVATWIREAKANRASR